jgi:response regulator RpfG family c-di-GMP phosphodiesterase
VRVPALRRAVRSAWCELKPGRRADDDRRLALLAQVLLRGVSIPGARRSPVTDSILFVDDTPQALDVIVRLVPSNLRVVTAANAEEAMEAFRRQGPFGVVVSDYEMPGTKGVELLARIRAAAPETVTMLLTGVVDVDVAIEALHSGRIFRFLEKPCPREVLLASVEDAFAEYRVRLEQHTRAVQVDFSCEVLTQFNVQLEDIVHEQSDALARLHRYASELSGCDSLESVALTAARAASELSGGRAASVELIAEARRAWPEQAELGESVYFVIESNDDSLGLLRVCARNRAGRALTSAQECLLRSVAASACVAAHNVLRRRERDEAQQATILALAKLAEHRDNETGKHLDRVSLFCRLIARGLREDGWFRDVITDEWIAILEKSAPLHDIGKVGVPDHILRKPGKLSPEEWCVMKTHAEIGAQTLRSVMGASSAQPFLAMSHDIAYAHHEKWDGGGYPRGLAGEQIPLCARIVALADVYDALTSDRPYKKAWKHEDALAWLIQGSGAHFDPRVVDAFARRAAQADEIRAKLADEPDPALPASSSERPRIAV